MYKEQPLNPQEGFSVGLLEQYQPKPLLRDCKQLEELSEQYDISKEDIALIALNCSGLYAPFLSYHRGRFDVTLPGNRSYKIALTITPKPLSRFEHDGAQVLLNGSSFLQAGLIEEDTCTDSYWRKGKQHLTLNSNLRSTCRGCGFCRTYDLPKDDEALLNATKIEKKAVSLCEETSSDLSKMEALGVVTGCFPDEEKVVDHLLLLRSVFKKYGFRGEIQYVGSQIRTSGSIGRLLETGPFSYYLTLECFQRRDILMKQTKASLALGQGVQLLSAAKKLGAETSFLYIAGLDDLEAIQAGFSDFSQVVTRMPLIQTFQLYQPEQIVLRHPEAQQLDYYLRTRILAESIFPDLIPDIDLNYRGLWFKS